MLTFEGCNNDPGLVHVLGMIQEVAVVAPISLSAIVRL
jgi:hypothetical protein